MKNEQNNEKKHPIIGQLLYGLVFAGITWILMRITMPEQFTSLTFSILFFVLLFAAGVIGAVIINKQRANRT